MSLNHLDFKLFAKPVEQRFYDLASNSNNVLVRVNIPTDVLWDTYLNAYPSELNTIFRERKHYDGNYDRYFIHRLGTILAIDENLQVKTIWGVDVPSYFKQVADAMHNLVIKYLTEMNAEISLFLTSEKIAGHLSNIDNYDTSIIWDHFYAKIPDEFVKKQDQIGTLSGKANTAYSMILKSLQTFDLDNVETVIELIESGSIYRGSEFLQSVKSFKALKERANKSISYLNLKLLSMRVSKLNPEAGFFKNSVIGTLLQDLADGVDLDKAVASFESKVAPTNYKRTSAVVTPKMIEGAKAKLVELGYEESIYRRFATTKDIPVENLLFTQSPEKVALDVFDDLAKDAKQLSTKQKDFSKVSEIAIEDFISLVLPKAKKVEVFVENKHKGNLVTLIAPEYPSSKNLFKWNNPISWAYNGDVTDAITERVKHFGGDVEGDFRISLSWHCADDLDLHLYEPNGNHIYYSNCCKYKSALGGMLDLDMNGIDKKDSENPVENIIYKNLPKSGTYKVEVHNYNRKSSNPNNFDLQIFHLSTIYNFSYPLTLRDNERAMCLSVELKGNDIKITPLNSNIKSSETVTEDVWGIKTGTFVNVTSIMLSPNYWGDNQVGNKHYFFTLEGCNSNEDQRGFFNEFLDAQLNEHRKVFELLGSKTKAKVESNPLNQVAGLGFSSTVRNSLVVKVTGAVNRVLKVKF